MNKLTINSNVDERVEAGGQVSKSEIKHDYLQVKWNTNWSEIGGN